MAMPMEDRADVVLDEKLMDGYPPAGAMWMEPIGSIHILPAPFKIWRGLDPAAAVLVVAADQIVDENEFELRAAGLDGRLEPVVLRLAEGVVPVGVQVIGIELAGGIPERVEDYE